MFKLLVKFIVLTVLVGLASMLIRKVIDLPYSWPIDYELARSVALEQDADRYNTIFIGSSKTHRGMKPKVFDDFLKKNSKVRTTSFNYGLSGSNSGQLFGLCRNLIQKKVDGELPKLKYIFYEIRSVQTSTIENLFNKNLHSSRDRLWMYDLKNLRFSIKNYWDLKDDRRYSFWNKVKYSALYFVKYISYKFNVGEVKDMIVRKQEQSTVDLSILGDSGYTPIEDKKDTRILKKKHREYIKDSTSLMRKARSRSYAAFGSKKEIGEMFQNKSYSDELTKLVEYAKEQGIFIIYVTHPMLRKEDYPQQKALYDGLPSRHRIQLTDSKKYPDLYIGKHYFDKTHTGDLGATALTERLAQQFLRLKGVKVKVPYEEK